MLELDGVTRQFDGEPVFTDVSLSVESGEVLAIIGPSGVGKTTLLRLLGLFESPDEGQVRYDGTDVWSVAEDERLSVRRDVGMVFQEANLFSASVRRNVAYGLRVRRSWPDRIRGEVTGRLDVHGTVDRVTDALDGVVPADPLESVASRLDGVGLPEYSDAVVEALATVGLSEKADQDARSLSGGEAQRVAFARALAYDPTVVLLDEPTSDLDPRNTAVIEAAVTDASDRGIGVAMATHDMNQARRVADRVAVMLDDGVVEVGPTAGIFDAPENERTRKFISGELVY